MEWRLGKFLLSAIFFWFEWHTIDAQNIIIKPYLQDITTQSAIVMWETDNAGKVYVDFGQSPFALNQTVGSNDQTGNGLTRIHTANLTGLNPGTKYFYKIRTETGNTSNIYHFYTIKPSVAESNTEFIAISDMQRDGANPGVFKSLIENGVVVVCDTILPLGFRDLEGILIPGDLVQNGGSYNTWRTDFFNLCDSVSPYVPLYPTLGNHEYYNGGFVNFIKYFTMPQNGTASNPDEWWYKDISNIRVIGINSNSGSIDLNKQLLWMDTVLQDAGNNQYIDFVFAQLHHPYKSELWTPGELDFTGDVIARLENFSSTYGKPSVHFFGHTHAYSRGSSRDHQHFWINVATAGGAIDNWGEFPNADYDEFTLSEDEYGFVLIQAEAGKRPKFRIRRFSRGDQNMVENNTLSDDFTIWKKQYQPQKPVGIYPMTDSIAVSCVKLKASAFDDEENQHQASHWQIAETCDFQNPNVVNIWKQSENWYNEVNTQAGDDLTDEAINTLQPNKSYCWRVRYRDQNFIWSEWSSPRTFYTKASNGTNTGNLLINSGAENNTTNWSGQIEALLSNECNSVPVFDGQRFFAVGGVCANESSVGYAHQFIDVGAYAAAIDAGQYQAVWAGYMRAYANNNDLPEMYLEFRDQNQNLLATTSSISNATPNWILKTQQAQIPANSRQIKVMLKGTRLAGTDNDSYFDNLSVQLVMSQDCPGCIGSPSGNADNDQDGYCAAIDCNDNNANVFPGKKESCDGIDNNCDGFTDSQGVVVWNGNGSRFWTDSTSWAQLFPPLPCQHVVLSGNDTIFIKERAYIQSLDVALGTTLKILPEAELIINGENNQNNVSAQVYGQIINEGRLMIKNSEGEGMLVNGMVNNIDLIEVQDVILKDIKILTGGLIQNLGAIRIK